MTATIDGRPLPIFPCYPNKRPACANGFKDATTHPGRIAALWAGRTGLLVGMPTGAASGMAVLDIDAAGMTWRASVELPPTREHQTRSGGRHLIYRHRPGLRCSQSLIASGVDVRADGGYVVWWPAHGCAVEDRLLAEWPDWLVPIRHRPPSQLPDGHLPLLETGELPPAPRTIAEEVAIFARFKKTVPRWSREETFAHYAVTKAMNELMDAREGQRNYILNAKGYALGRLVARGWIDGDMVVFALGHGAKCCGYVRDHGEAATVVAIRHAVLDGMKRPYADLAACGGD